MRVENGKYVIEHLGKILTTSHYHEMSDDMYNKLILEYYEKPDKHEVYKELYNIHKGGVSVAKVTNFYMKDLMAKVKLYTPRWSIEEVLQSKELVEYFYSRVLSSDKVYPKHLPLINNFECALRLSGGGVAMKPSNFLMNNVDKILEKYNINDNYYDFSCGWGVRLLSSMKNRINYYGTDPNFMLFDRLNSLKDDYNLVNNTNCKIDIRCTGSETYHSDWKNTIGVAFSSPPYFNLEDYKIGNQSYSSGTSYSQWLSGYMVKTIENIHEYLISGGYFLINVKDFSKFKLCADIKQLSEEIGFEYIESLILNNHTRTSAKKNLNTDESILVFKK